MFKSVEEEKRALDYSPGSSNNDSSVGPSISQVTKALTGQLPIHASYAASSNHISMTKEEQMRRRDLKAWAKQE